MTFQLSSAGFLPGESIPSRYTCEGEDLSPPLAWTDPPDRTKSFALIVDDPDAPDPAAPKQVWVHWILYDLPSEVLALNEAMGDRVLPPGTRQGLNDRNRIGYGGPCPPVGRHRYFFRLYALDVQLGDLGTPKRKDLDRAMQNHILGEAVLMGTYQKTGR